MKTGYVLIVVLAVFEIATAAVGVLPRTKRNPGEGESTTALTNNSTCGPQVQNIYIQPVVVGSEPATNREPGPQGEQGLPGPQGPVGPQGQQGINGTQGEQGPAGPQGQQGLTGPKGLQGSTGPKGMQGERGYQGSRGYTGSQGPPGYTGSRGPPGPTAGGATYIRWGRDDCPSTPGTELLYSGMAGGSFYTQAGGGSNYLCLPNNPQYLIYNSGVTYERAHVYGAEYEVYGTSAFAGMKNHNVPCAVCYTPTRGTKIMIPARTSCPSSWTREYYGYLMAGRFDYKHSPPFECVDVNPEAIPGSSANTDGALFFFTESRCHGICPPYTEGRELTCTVCTK